MLEIKPEGTEIPTGYVVEIVSWENDADHYRTTTHAGLTEEDVQFLKNVLPLYDIDSDEIYENFNVDSLLYHLASISHPSAAKFFGECAERFSTKKAVDDLVNGLNPTTSLTTVKEILYEKLCKLLHEPVEYGWGHVRVFSNMNIYYFEQSITIPPFKEVK